MNSEVVAAALQDAYGHRLVQGQELWPTGPVLRLILQFRVEFRIGERTNEISLIHRVNANVRQRSADRARLEAMLQSLEQPAFG